MKRTLYLPCVAMILVLSACSTSLTVTDGTTPSGSQKDYFGYYLPKTLLKIKVPIEEAEFKPGLVNHLSASKLKSVLKYLFVSYGWEPVKKDEDKYSIGEKIQFIPQTVPDTDKYFTLQYSGAKALANSMGLVLTRDGMISSGEFAQEDKTFEYVTKGVELLAHTASILMGLGNKSGEPAVVPFCSDAETDQYVLRICALIGELNNISATKADLIKNATNGVASNDPLKYRTELIDKRILKIKEEILGRYKKTIFNVSLIYEPGNDRETVALLKLSPSKGIVIPKMTNNDPARTALAGIIATSEDGAKPLTLLVEPAYTLKAPRTRFVDSKGFGREHFLVYNVPAKFKLTLVFDGKPLKSFQSEEDEKGTDIYEIYFPQRGMMAALPVDFKEMKVVFIEDLGSIKEIKSSKGAELTATQVSAGVAALDSVLTLRNKIRESKKEKPAAEETEETKEQVIRLIIEQPQTPPPPVQL